MRVSILISIPDTNYFDNCVLIFKTLRVGFPTAEVEVFINNIGLLQDRYRASDLAYAAGASRVFNMDRRVHHADWIKNCVTSCPDGAGPLIILDGDIHFWKSCEDWKFDPLMAGYYVPEMMNDWAQCRSLPRLHTSFLWFSRPQELTKAIDAACPLAGEYVPYNPFMCSVQYINGERLFWDTCANLYNTIGGAHFTQDHTNCYEHLNSAGFVDEMVRRMGPATGADFKMFHTLAPKDMNFVKNFCWAMVKKYYLRKQCEAAIVPSLFRQTFDSLKS